MIQELHFTSSVRDGKVDLDVAYTYCASVTREHSKSFYFSTQFLPPEKRRAIRAFYAFCRATDDIVDRPMPGTAQDSVLEEWRVQSRLPGRAQCDPILSAWADTRDRYGVPQQLIEELIDGCEMDLHVTRYETFDDLRQYCYRVASTVGLVSMHIIGTDTADPAQLAMATHCAIQLGVALQLTNILRDVGEDLDRGRVYLPQEELRRFRYTEQDLCAGLVDDRFRELMQFQIERAHRWYDQGWPGIVYLRREGRLAVGAAISLYRDILHRIVANDYNVFTRRASLGALAKISRIPAIYMRVRALKAACLA